MASFRFGNIPATFSPYLLLLCFLQLSTPHLSLSQGAGAEDIHDLLPKLGLPRGLIPGNVKSYEVSPLGYFSINLSNPCYVQFHRLVHFDTQIRGKIISYGLVTDLSGILVKELFVWIPLAGINRAAANGSGDGDDTVEFQVGVFTETYPANKFEAVPPCLTTEPSVWANFGLDSII
ncbi:hypothetical protein Tsubulata_006117 [Turnera subulata]|uniref:Uncharacterized protein n=1 Tax=Turnera subulata TaxID=218843 RepID=A0A9Q0FZ48_9ROSI|nr:hypothetical protein Tsubulata_006117 [Turnera subulata]